MIYPKLKLIHIHIPKTAGRFLKAQFDPYKSYYPSKFYKLYSNKIQLLHFGKHLTLAEYQELLGDSKFNQYNTIATIRNPIELEISLYKHFARNEYSEDNELSLIKNFNFSNYLNWRIENNYYIFRDQTHYLLDKDNKLKIDNLISFGNLNMDLKNFFEMNNLQFNYNLEPVGKGNKKDIILSKSDEKLLRDMYKRDIENFKFNI